MSEKDTAKLKRSFFGRFLVPEDIITLKVIFDNVKNYALCGAIIVVYLAASRSVSEDPSLPFHRFMIGAIALILVLLSFMQSLEIWWVTCLHLRVRDQQNGRPEKETFKGCLKWAAFKAITFIIVIIISVALLYVVVIGLGVVILTIQNGELFDKKLPR